MLCSLCGCECQCQPLCLCTLCSVLLLGGVQVRGTCLFSLAVCISMYQYVSVVSPPACAGLHLLLFYLCSISVLSLFYLCCCYLSVLCWLASFHPAYWACLFTHSLTLSLSLCSVLFCTLSLYPVPAVRSFFLPATRGPHGKYACILRSFFP